MFELRFREPPSYINLPMEQLTDYQKQNLIDYHREEQEFYRELDRLEAMEEGRRERLEIAALDHAEQCGARAITAELEDLRRQNLSAKIEAIRQDRQRGDINASGGWQSGSTSALGLDRMSQNARTNRERRFAR